MLKKSGKHVALWHACWDRYMEHVEHVTSWDVCWGRHIGHVTSWDVCWDRYIGHDTWWDMCWDRYVGPRTCYVMGVCRDRYIQHVVSWDVCWDRYIGIPASLASLQNGKPHSKLWSYVWSTHCRWEMNSYDLLARTGKVLKDLQSNPQRQKNRNESASFLNRTPQKGLHIQFRRVHFRTSFSKMKTEWPCDAVMNFVFCGPVISPPGCLSPGNLSG